MIDIFGDGRFLPINILGNAAGIWIFAVFIVLVLGHRSGHQSRANRLPLTAATLALIWNVTSILIIAVGRNHQSIELSIAAIGFCALSILPSVLLDLCLGERFREIVRAGYVLSALSALAHGIELIRDPADFHRLGLAIITIGFGILSIAAVFRVLWLHESGFLTMRLLSAMSLFLFAVSFVHFGGAEGSHRWSTELIVHHAGIPLALFIIMQDYRFILLDAFVRFLVNGLLATFFALALVFYVGKLDFVAQIGCVCAILIAFVSTRTLFQRLLTRLVFRRSDVDGVMRAIRALHVQVEDEAACLKKASALIADSMTAARWQSIVAGTPLDVDYPTLTITLPDARQCHETGAEIVVPFGHSQYLLLGPRQGGRRYLSEDFAILARMGACVGEQIELIRQAEGRRLVADAELRALQAQIHPHFLFNAFNTLYGTIPRQAASARRTVLNLAEIFRYFLQSDQAFVSLEDEIRITRAYLEIEELRLNDKLRVSMEIDDAALSKVVPVLSIEPLVENAVKHGIAMRPEGGTIRICAKLDGRQMRVSVCDTGPGFTSEPRSRQNHTGVGLENVTKRLTLCYGPEAKLEINSTPQGTSVGFVIPCERATSVSRSERGSVRTNS